MTTATEFQLMARDRIQPSPLNPRKAFDEGKLQELAASMAHGVGIIEPLVVRSRPDLNCYELIAGERRWRAAAIAGLEQVPVLVKELSDAQVLEIMVIENNQREDITPLEEAAGFKQLLTLGVFEVDALAARLGRSRKYVYDRMKLLALVPEAQALLARGRITAGHAILLARLTPDQQRRALDPETALESYGDDVGLFRPDLADERGAVKGDPYAGLQVGSVREFQAWIQDHIRLELGADETRGEYPRLAASLEKASTVVHLTLDWHSGDVATDGGPRIYAAGDWKRADGKHDSKKCPAAVTGVVVLGRRERGAAFPVCVDQACAVHWPTAAPATSAASAKSAQRWKAQQAADLAKRQRWEQAAPAIVAACVARIGTAKPAQLAEFILEADYLDRATVTRATKLLPASAIEDAIGVLTRLATAALICVIERGSYRAPAVTVAVKRIGVDVPAILRQVQTSAPATTATKKVAAKATKKVAAKATKKVAAKATKKVAAKATKKVA